MYSLNTIFSTSLLLYIIWIIIEFSSYSSSSHIHLQFIFIFKSSSSLDLDHHSIQIIAGTSSLDLDHQSIWIITRSGSSLDLGHHCWIIITGSSSHVLSHDSSCHKKFYRASPFSCQLQAQPLSRSSSSSIVISDPDRKIYSHNMSERLCTYILP